MTPEKQRIAIAEACGWDVDPAEALGWGSRGQWCVRPNDESRQLVSKNMELPYYLSDLNAMHEAEKMLTDAEHKQYRATLRRIAGGLTNEASKFELANRAFVSATAAQRAEAFLRTLGKWE